MGEMLAKRVELLQRNLHVTGVHPGVLSLCLEKITQESDRLSDSFVRPRQLRRALLSTPILRTNHGHASFKPCRVPANSRIFFDATVLPPSAMSNPSLGKLRWFWLWQFYNFIPESSNRAEQANILGFFDATVLPPSALSDPRLANLRRPDFASSTTPT